MKTEFTAKYIKENKGCYKLSQVNRLSFIKNSVITINDIINSEMPDKDKIWWLLNKCNWSSTEKYKFINNNKKIRNILAGHGLVFYYSYFVYYFCYVSVEYFTISEKNIILSEILNHFNN